MTKPWWTRALLGRTAVSNPLQEDDGPDPQFETQWRPLIKRRLFAIFAVLAVWVTALEGRLIWIQVKDHGYWTQAAKHQQEGFDKIEAPRGDLLDRNGRVLALSVTSYDVVVNPKKFREAKAAKEDRDRKNAKLGKVSKRPDELALILHDWPSFVGALCGALSDCEAGEPAALVAKLDTTKALGVVVRRARNLSPNAVPELQAFLDKLGKMQEIVSLIPKFVRYYPNVELASHVVGFLNGDGDPKAGVEAKFDALLKGDYGTKYRQIDAYFNEIYTSIIKTPQPGVTLELTIDVNLQEIVERELHRVMEEAGASAATAVVLDSATGEVLAMASLPNYNPNLRGQATPAEQRNRAIQDLYEPGSTFKMVTLSAGLNEGVINPNTIIDTNPGWMMVEGRPTRISEDRGHNYGALTPEGVLMRSSNVGAARIGLMLGAEKMLQYARAMGFTTPPQTTQRDFFSEQFGSINARGGLTKAGLAVVSYGYQVTASPLQIATAMNVFATGGLLLRPRLIHATIQNGVRTVLEPEVLGRPVTAETAATMVSMLESVVDDPLGTGKFARLDRYQVAGKTGTTKKNLAGGYSETDYLVSFVGFVPSRHPKFTIGVLVDRPTKLPAYGGAVSAPVFKRIAEAALHYVGEPPSLNPAPAVIVTDERPQAPRPPVRPAADPVVVNAGGVPTMPDLSGLTLRDAIKLLPAGFTIDAHGNGVVVSQAPAAGEAITTTTTRGVLRLQPAKAGGSNR